LGKRLAAWLAENPGWRGLITISVLLLGLARVWTARPQAVAVWPVIAAVVVAHAAGYTLDRWVGVAARLAVGLAVFILGWLRVQDMYPVLAAGFILLSPSPYVRLETAAGRGKDEPDRAGSTDHLPKRGGH